MNRLQLGISIAFGFGLLLNSCTPGASKRGDQTFIMPQLPITGHYFETIQSDSETQRRGVEIELVVAKEREIPWEECTAKVENVVSK